MLPGMRAKPAIAIVGAGNFASSLAPSLRRAGYAIETVVSRVDAGSLKRARRVARDVGAVACSTPPANLHSRVVWFCVPDSQIGHAADLLADRINWKGRLALHSSGALTSDALQTLRQRGASVGSVHPLMTFVAGSRPTLAGVPFAIEADRAAMRIARKIIKDLGGRAYPIRKAEKAAYHAWGTFVSPLFTALLATAERVAGLAGVPAKVARSRAIPILLQTLANYALLGADAGFSGPLVRGDVETVKRHLRVLRSNRQASDVYRALAMASLHYLPVKNKQELEKTLHRGRRRS